MTLWHTPGYAGYTTSCAGRGIDQRTYRLDYDAHAIATWITNLGNLAVVAPTAVLVWVWLVWRRGVGAAIRYQWPVAVTFVVTVTLKFVSRAQGGVFTGTPYALSIGAPSGHMAMSTVVYGGVAMMLLRRGAEPIVLLSTMLTVCVLAGVGVTRVILHAHTPADVLAGFLVGGTCAVWMGSVAEVPAREPVRYIGELAMMMAGVVLLMHFSGLRFNSTNVM